MNKRTFLASMAALAIINTACIHDDEADCRFDYVVDISIQDKNYDNIAQFPELSPENENLPFSHFSGTIYYTLTDANTQQVVQQSELLIPNGSSSTYSIPFSKLPMGEYQLTVWGNQPTNIGTGSLHPNGQEHTDIYLGTTLLNINDKSSSSQLQLKRAKGKVVIFCKNLPNSITRLHQKLNNIYGQIDANMNYSQPISIDKDSQPTAINLLTVAPTTTGQTSHLSLDFYEEDNNTPVFTISDIPLDISRNKLSAVTIDYDEESNSWTIWNYVNGEWTLFHHLDIE